MTASTTKQLRWGILGTGNIARQFCGGLSTSRRTRAVAVGSRTSAAAESFAREQGIHSAFGSYEGVLIDSHVDAVYVSLPNSMHHEWVIKALEAGKHVLNEKPFASNLAESEEMFAVARKKGLVLIEGFMYRAHPLMHEVMKTVKAGAIGKVKMVRSSFCYRTTRIGGNIRFDPKLAGGALMDIGCYCLSFSRMVAGCEPTEARAFGVLHASGVDEMVVGSLSFPNGVLGSFTCGMGLQVDNTAYIAGEEGYIEIPVPWKPARENAVYTVARGTPPKMDLNGQKPGPPPRETRRVDAGKDLYALEADAFAATVLEGAEPFFTEQDSLGNMKLLDELRRQVL